MISWINCFCATNVDTQNEANKWTHYQQRGQNRRIAAVPKSGNQNVCNISYRIAELYRNYSEMPFSWFIQTILHRYEN